MSETAGVQTTETENRNILPEDQPHEERFDAEVWVSSPEGRKKLRAEIQHNYVHPILSLGIELFGTKKKLRAELPAADTFFKKVKNLRAEIDEAALVGEPDEIQCGKFADNFMELHSIAEGVDALLKKHSGSFDLDPTLNDAVLEPVDVAAPEESVDAGVSVPAATSVTESVTEPDQVARSPQDTAAARKAMAEAEDQYQLHQFQPGDFDESEIKVFRQKAREFKRAGNKDVSRNKLAPKVSKREPVKKPEALGPPSAEEMTQVDEAVRVVNDEILSGLYAGDRSFLYPNPKEKTVKSASEQIRSALQKLPDVNPKIAGGIYSEYVYSATEVLVETKKTIGVLIDAGKERKDEEFKQALEKNGEAEDAVLVAVKEAIAEAVLKRGRPDRREQKKETNRTGELAALMTETKTKVAEIYVRYDEFRDELTALSSAVGELVVFYEAAGIAVPDDVDDDALLALAESFELPQQGFDYGKEKKLLEKINVAAKEILGEEAEKRTAPERRNKQLFGAVQRKMQAMFHDPDFVTKYADKVAEIDAIMTEYETLFTEAGLDTSEPMADPLTGVYLLQKLKELNLPADKFEAETAILQRLQVAVDKVAASVETIDLTGSEVKPATAERLGEISAKLAEVMRDDQYEGKLRQVSRAMSRLERFWDNAGLGVRISTPAATMASRQAMAELPDGFDVEEEARLLSQLVSELDSVTGEST